MNKIMYALGLASLCYFVANKWYDKGVSDTIKKLRAYAEKHPDETFGEFFQSNEEV